MPEVPRPFCFIACKVHPFTVNPENTKQPHRPNTDPLDVGVVGDGGDSLGEVALGADNVGVAGHDGLALQVQVNTLLLGLALLDGVLLDTVDELLTRAGVRNVLDADVDTLLEVAVADTLVDDDTNGGLGNVVHDTGLTVVDLVGHTAKILSQGFLRDFD